MTEQLCLSFLATKRCTRCRVEKSRNEFSKCKRSGDGLQYQCVTCSREYYQANRERILERNRQHYQANKERIKEYRQANKERIKEYRQAYRQANKERIKEYYQANKERFRERFREYYQANYEPVSMPIVIGEQESYIASSWEQKLADQFLGPMGIEFEWLSARGGTREPLQTPFGSYLPDFYLPQIDGYVEVKGKVWDQKSPRQSRKREWLNRNGHRIWTLYGDDLRELGVKL